MTFDRFMKEFFAEELKDFPNTVYKNDCWYSFTPQGVMHQVFVLKRSRGSIWLEYASYALISELLVHPGNEIKKVILGGRPRNVADLEYKSRYLETNLPRRYTKINEAENVQYLRALIREIIMPYFSTISVIKDLYLQCCRKGASVAVEYAGKGPVPPPAFSFASMKQACDICAYLKKSEQGLLWIQQAREHDLCYYKSQYNPAFIGTENYRDMIQQCQNEYQKEEHFLHLCAARQREGLREAFAQNSAKISEILKINPEFDMDFIFPEK